MLNPLLQSNEMLFLFYEINEKTTESSNNVYCKCNIHSSVSIEGGPAFSVNRLFSKSMHIGNKSHSKLEIKEIVLMKTLQPNGNNRNRVNGTTLNYFIEDENNTSAWRLSFLSLIYATSILPISHFSSIAAFRSPLHISLHHFYPLSRA
jgi:hypothetical protein